MIALLAVYPDGGYGRRYERRPVLAGGGAGWSPCRCCCCSPVRRAAGVGLRLGRRAGAATRRSRRSRARSTSARWRSSARPSRATSTPRSRSRRSRPALVGLRYRRLRAASRAADPLADVRRARWSARAAGRGPAGVRRTPAPRVDAVVIVGLVALPGVDRHRPGQARPVRHRPRDAPLARLRAAVDRDRGAYVGIAAALGSPPRRRAAAGDRGDDRRDGAVRAGPAPPRRRGPRGGRTASRSAARSSCAGSARRSSTRWTRAADGAIAAIAREGLGVALDVRIRVDGAEPSSTASRRRRGAAGAVGRARARRRAPGRDRVRAARPRPHAAPPTAKCSRRSRGRRRWRSTTRGWPASWRRSLEEIKAQAAELAASRSRIVAAQESARRQIERDIHDGAQQELVALIARIGLAQNQLGRDSSGWARRSSTCSPRRARRWRTCASSPRASTRRCCRTTASWRRSRAARRACRWG